MRSVLQRLFIIVGVPVAMTAQAYQLIIALFAPDGANLSYMIEWGCLCALLFVMGYFGIVEKRGWDAVPVSPFLLGFVLSVAVCVVAPTGTGGYGVRERAILVTCLYGIQVCFWLCLLMEACRVFRDDETPARKVSPRPTVGHGGEGP